MVNIASPINRAQPEGEVLHLPFVVLRNVSWSTYQALVADMGNHRAARLAYLCGTLEIKMPSKHHESINRLLARIITTLTEELGLEIVPLGSTRFDKEEGTQGVEPDSCFYIEHAACIDPEDNAPPQDIPPDLVVEVDITSSSKSRLTIYQIMGVPEVWRYTRQGMTIFQLSQGTYSEGEYSLTFPSLSTDALTRWVEQGKKSKNHNRLMADLRTWIREQQQ